MALLIQPYTLSGESLLGYLYRSAFVNHYKHMGVLFKLFGIPRGLDISLLSHQVIERISSYTGLDCETLTSLSLNTLEREIHDKAIFHKILYKRGLKYCPACLRNTPHHRLAWNFEVIDICLEHRIQLLNSCFCGKKVNYKDLIKSTCECGHDLCDVPICNVRNNTVIESQRKLLELIMNPSQTTSFSNLSLSNGIQLIFASLYLVDGMKSHLINVKQVVERTKKESLSSGALLIEKIAMVNWMYTNFPINFKSVLEDFISREKGTQKFWKKTQFEQLLMQNDFSEINEAYQQFWIEQLTKGNRRRVLRVISSRHIEVDEEVSNSPIIRQQSFNETKHKNNRITLIEASLMLGLDRLYVRKLVNVGYLEPMIHQGKRYVKIESLLDLIVRCRGAIIVEHTQRITIREILMRYPGLGLSVISLIGLILEGKLTPASRRPNSSFNDITFDIQEVAELIDNRKKDCMNNQFSIPLNY
ncbi:TniQ family protein [Paenibacillus filicis]|uniref:TniQ family protein n=1 Tax=Paenibacillus gyeongsangnamensis TaxID=3388067 RepID=A0ABT4Q947_9BACL|nr:TniQ family protein [Paenibacillus filicis]MCZ8513393.1 TniQ family protein [Paenibacillus filicis]